MSVVNKPGRFSVALNVTHLTILESGAVGEVQLQWCDEVALYCDAHCRCSTASGGWSALGKGVSCSRGSTDMR